MSVEQQQPLDLQATFPTGTVLFNPVTGEYGRLAEHTPDRVVGELMAAPGGAVAGPHLHPAQEEAFEVVAGVMGYRRGDERGELGAGEGLTVPAGVVHDWWNAGDDFLRARVTVTPPGNFAAMIGAVWGLAASGRTNAKGMPRLLDAALLAEAFGDEIVFERPPRIVQRAFVRVIAPVARRRGHAVAEPAVIEAAVVPAERWPAA
jgi:quercetin dioxygenase-like cupin family protein